MRPFLEHRVAWLLVMAALSAGCGRDEETSTERSITVFTAASLVEAFRELGSELERRTPGLTVRLNAAGSQQLAAQLVQGAEGDVFASADGRWMRYVEGRGLVVEPELLAHSRLVLATSARPEVTSVIVSLLNLASPGVKIVLATPEVPAGAYAQVVLDNLSRAPGYGSDFAERVRLGVVSYEDNVRSALMKVRLGEADAAMVYAADVAVPDSLVRVIPIPPAYNVRTDYFIAPARAQSDTAAVREFMELVRSPTGQEILSRHGFELVGEQ